MSIEVCSRCGAQEDTDFIIGSYDDKGYICSDCVEGMQFKLVKDGYLIDWGDFDEMLNKETKYGGEIREWVTR